VGPRTPWPEPKHSLSWPTSAKPPSCTRQYAQLRGWLEALTYFPPVSSLTRQQECVPATALARALHTARPCSADSNRGAHHLLVSDLLAVRGVLELQDGVQRHHRPASYCKRQQVPNAASRLRRECHTRAGTQVWTGATFLQQSRRRRAHLQYSSRSIKTRSLSLSYTMRVKSTWIVRRLFAAHSCRKHTTQAVGAHTAYASALQASARRQPGCVEAERRVPDIFPRCCLCLHTHMVFQPAVCRKELVTHSLRQHRRCCTTGDIDLRWSPNAGFAGLQLVPIELAWGLRTIGIMRQVPAAHSEGVCQSTDELETR
jgi:hypothetical protein